MELDAFLYKKVKPFGMMKRRNIYGNHIWKNICDVSHLVEGKQW